MAITKEKKQVILSKLDEIKKDANSLVFVGFNGLSVADSTTMRRKMRDEGVGYFVAKKTLIRRSLGDAYSGEMPVLDGEVAVAYSADSIAPAQQVRDFAKQHQDRIVILGGVFEGVYKNKEEMTEIASIPALPVLRGMFVNVINAPIQGLVLGLNAIAEKKNA
ncbi:50S ribosomal protein L10 [Candidatus Kaiserbacteria bacterium]|nr:50S ribosomal protein L10 [Candidatus Kaiserbacteria bacterium]